MAYAEGMIWIALACATNVAAPPYGDDTDAEVDEVDEDVDEDEDEDVDADGDGYTEAEGDCDDDNPFAYPDALEIENGIDDDCDGLVDEPSGGLPDSGLPPDDTGLPPDDGDCGVTAPAMTGLSVENGGLYDFGSGPAPSLLFVVEASDADGDLHDMAIDVWHDQEPDGLVDTSGSAPIVAMVTISSEACEVPTATVHLSVGVGHSMPYGTEMDFAVAVVDAQGHLSDSLVVTGWTPLEDGSDP